MVAPTAQIFDWFLKFSGFTHDSTTGLRNNFDRLASQRNWGKKLRATQWINCQKATFDHMYNDADISKLEKWQDLCAEVGLSPVPGSIKACKKALGSRRVMVNLVNLIDHRTIGVQLIRFSDYEHFINYTKKKGRKYPLELAKDEGFIKALLRKL